MVDFLEQIRTAVILGDLVGPMRQRIAKPGKPA